MGESFDKTTSNLELFSPWAPTKMGYSSYLPPWCGDPPVLLLSDKLSHSLIPTDLSHYGLSYSQFLCLPKICSFIVMMSLTLLTTGSVDLSLSSKPFFASEPVLSQCLELFVPNADTIGLKIENQSHRHGYWAWLLLCKTSLLWGFCNIGSWIWSAELPEEVIYA